MSPPPAARYNSGSETMRSRTVPSPPRQAPYRISIPRTLTCSPPRFATSCSHCSFVGARQRQQGLHRRVGGDAPRAHGMLNRLRQNLHQPQAAADPACRTQKGPGKSLPAHPVDASQFLEQPPLLQGAPPAGTLQAVRKQEGGRLVHRKNHRVHRVPAKPAQQLHATVPVDQHVSTVPAFHHQRGNVLARLGQRGEKPPLPNRIGHAKIPVPQIQLMELQIHPLRRPLRPPDNDGASPAVPATGKTLNHPPRTTAEPADPGKRCRNNSRKCPRCGTRIIHGFFCMKTTMPARRIPPALPAMRRLPVTLLRRAVEPAPGQYAAHRPAIPLATVTPAADMERYAAAAATQEKQQDDGHDLPSGGRRGAVVKRQGVPRPVPSGSAELASKVRSCPLRTFTCFIPTTDKWPSPPGTPPAADRRLTRQQSFGMWTWGKREKPKTGRSDPGGAILMSRGGVILVGGVVHT